MSARLCLYSPIMMDGQPALMPDGSENPEFLACLEDFQVVILSLASLARNKGLTDMVRKHMRPEAELIGYVDAFTRYSYLDDAPDAVLREPDAMTTRVWRMAKDLRVERGDYLDVGRPGVIHELSGIWLDALWKSGLIWDRALFFDSVFETPPFNATAQQRADWQKQSMLLMGWWRSLCNRRMVVNPSWYPWADWRFSERWPDLEAVDPVASFMARRPHGLNGSGPSGGIIFLGFDPVLGWPDTETMAAKTREAAADAWKCDAFLCVGPTDLNWKADPELRSYWRWQRESWWPDL